MEVAWPISGSTKIRVSQRTLITPPTFLIVSAPASHRMILQELRDLARRKSPGRAGSPDRTCCPGNSGGPDRACDPRGADRTCDS